MQPLKIVRQFCVDSSKIGIASQSAGTIESLAVGVKLATLLILSHDVFVVVTTDDVRDDSVSSSSDACYSVSLVELSMGHKWRTSAVSIALTQGYTMVRPVAKKKAKKYNVPTEIRRLARERVGAVPSPKLIVPKKQRKKPKHKQPPGEEAE
jgi:acetyl-CoA acetyltransferase